MDETNIANRENRNYAGFWIRFAASFIDGIIILIIDFLIVLVLGNSIASEFIEYIITLAYYVLLQSSAKQATLGKMALGLKVTDLEGRRISILRAIARELAKIISALIIFIGFIMVAFTPKKQGLHDMIAGTLVEKKS